MAEILLEETSPLGTVAAVVEDDGRVVYLYLHYLNLDEDDPQRMKVCWVRNRLAAPRKLDEAAMERGDAPLMPASHCVDPGPGRPLEPDALRIVWLEECDAAALVEHDETLAVIPWWSGTGDFSGYARDCLGQGPFAWELSPDNAMHERIVAAAEFWNLWDDEDLWQRWRDERIAVMENTLGEHSKYYAIDGDEFPPRALLRFDLPDRYVLITVGVSLFCLPRVDHYFDDPSPHRRIELAAAVDRQCPETEVNRVGQYLSAQARYPWNHFIPLGHGHTMPCDSLPAMFDSRRFESVLFSQTMPGTPQFELPDFRGDRTNVLWLVPISQRERDFAKKSGSGALEQQLIRAGTTVVMRARKELSLPT
jgi:hypothetical protein